MAHVRSGSASIQPAVRRASITDAYVAPRVADLDLYAYLRRLCAVAQKLAAERARRRDEDDQAQLAAQVTEQAASRLPKGELKALMAYFKQLALDKAPTIDPSLKRSYLAFYAQLLDMKSAQSADLEAVAQSADLLIVKFLAVVSKVAGAALVSVQGSLFVELLRTLAKKNGGSAALDAQLAQKQHSFSEHGKKPKPVASPPGALDADEIAAELARVMLVSPTLFARDIQQEQHITLDQVALVVAHALQNAQDGQHPVYTQSDFSSPAALQQVLAVAVDMLETLAAQLPPPPASWTGSTTPDLVPKDARAYYTLLLERCIEADAGGSVLFGTGTRALLQFVAKFWCLSARTRAACLAYATAKLYERGAADIQVAARACEYAAGVLAREPDGEWPASDRRQLAAALNVLRQALIERVASAMRQLYKKPPKIGALVELASAALPALAALADLPPTIVPAQLRLVKAQIEASAEEEYDRMIAEIPRDQSLDAEHVLQLLEAVLEGAQRLQNRYPRPLFDALPVASLVGTVHLRLLNSDFASLWDYCSKQSALAGREPSFETVRALHDSLVALADLGKQLTDSALFAFDFELLLFPYFQGWAAASGALAREWVAPAIAQDANVPLDLDNGVRHSSGVQDLFKSFYSTLALVDSVSWQAFYYRAQLYTRIVEHISESVCDWASQVQQAFFAALRPQRVRDDDWLTAVASSKSPEPFEFSSEDGVRLNNVAAAFSMLHDMESKLHADDISTAVRARERRLSASRRIKPSAHLFTITIINAKNLRSKGALYVTLVDQDSRRQVGKTRTVAASVLSTWNDTFELRVADMRPRLLKATVWCDAAHANHALAGRAIVKLDPKEFARREYGMHVYNIDLDGARGAQLQVMVTVDAEQDDIRFYFGRALRFLKRAQDSMVDAVVTQFSAYVHAVLSKQTLREVTGQGGLATSVQSSVTQLQKGLSMLLRKEQPTAPASEVAEAERDALDPLFDYLNANFATLAAVLTSELRIEVLSRTWDVILDALELLVLPPLDSAPTAQAQLSSAEMEAVYSWLSSLRDFFYSDGAGPSLERLQSQAYQQIMAIPVYYDLPTSQLKTECEKIVRQNLRALASSNELVARQRTVMAHRNRSVIEHQGRELRAAQRSAPRLDDVVLRILRMRGEGVFIEQHLRFREKLLQREMTERALQGSLSIY